MRVLVAIEQRSIGFADAAITCTEQMRRAFVQRGADLDKISVVLNTVNPEFFRDPVLPDPAIHKQDTFRIVTHGTITKRYGHDILIRAMALVVKKVPETRLEIMGKGNWQTELEQLVEMLGLCDVVTFAGYLPIDDLIVHLRAADCGVVSLPRNIETDLVHTHKMQEYMALGIPAIVSRTEAVEAYYDNSCIHFFEPGNEKDLARAIIDLCNNPYKRYRLAKNALRAYERYSASKQKSHYLDLVHKWLGRETSSD